MNYTEYKQNRNKHLERTIYKFDDGFEGYFKYIGDIVGNFILNEKFIDTFPDPNKDTQFSYKLSRFGRENVLWEYLPIEEVLNDPDFHFVCANSDQLR